MKKPKRKRKIPWKGPGKQPLLGKIPKDAAIGVFFGAILVYIGWFHGQIIAWPIVTTGEWLSNGTLIYDIRHPDPTHPCNACNKKVDIEKLHHVPNNKATVAFFICESCLEILSKAAQKPVVP